MGLRFSFWLHDGAEDTQSWTASWSSSMAVPTPARLSVLLSSSPEALGHVLSKWSPFHHSPHLLLSACKEEVTRTHVEQSSDGARAETGVNSGLHIWEVLWSQEQRGSHAVIGIATKNCPLQVSGYNVLVGRDSQSWGWELKTNQLWHDGKSRGFYPRNCYNFRQLTSSDSSFDIPDKVLLVLDADVGILGFIVNGSFLGTAFEGLPHGVDLFPAVSSVRGGATIRLRYLNGARREPPTLMALCRLSICQNLKEEQTDKLPLPPRLQHYLSSSWQETEKNS
ncbi:SPRY domain-containing SOCS box protein 4 [Boleophthalmus pectinirostris]|uniref:SPRY domain-containing SOCS box protein 4 n=1 Tax=Boleophthalmus pectinirostris TaxID=150288 RepID=UPI0024324782|nr:SPRY domain-containing SOCS box protein 4 [Boleophthalmus pectinirostris]